MTDKDLLEKAAKAAGIKCKWQQRMGLTGGPINEYFVIDSGENLPPEWNPLTDDGDALRLAVKLDLTVTPGKTKASVTWWVPPQMIEQDSVIDPHNSDPYAATRRAIVRAAAEIGEKT